MTENTTNKHWTRRQALGFLTAAGAALSAACNGDTPTSPSTTTPLTTTPASPSGTCVVTPTETVGPFPSLSDFVRSDIREGKPGLPVTLAITVVNTNNGCAPVANASVDIWQCDASGNYSQYGSERNLTYLRGIQPTDANGVATFTTIYPGWYQGRATHIHVEVSINGRSVKVTQIAFPEDVSATVYRTGAYAPGGQNPTTNARDMVFGDGASDEMAMIVGDTTNGYQATFRVGVAI